MGRKRHTPERIITALREAEVGLAPLAVRLAFEFLVLTAARWGEVRWAEWALSGWRAFGLVFRGGTRVRSDSMPAQGLDSSAMIQAHHCPARAACFDAGHQTTEPVPHEHPSLRQRAVPA